MSKVFKVENLAEQIGIKKLIVNEIIRNGDSITYNGIIIGAGTHDNKKQGFSLNLTKENEILRFETGHVYDKKNKYQIVMFFKWACSFIK